RFLSLLIFLISFLLITYSKKFFKALYYAALQLNNHHIKSLLYTVGFKKRMSSYMDIELDQIELEFNQLKNEFNPENSSFNQNDFKQFINGFYQAEGTISIYFKEKQYLRVGFYFAIGQNYTPEVAKMFILLQHFLGGIGKFKFEELSNGNKHIRFVVTNREDIIYKVKPYFSLLYGQKRLAFNKLVRIYEITKNPLLYNDSNLVSELIQLVYSINLEGKKIKLPLSDKLATFNFVKSEKNFIQAPSPTPYGRDGMAVDLNQYTSYAPLREEGEENFQYPSILFIIGLFLGDGSLYFSFDANKTILPKFNIKIVCEIVGLKDTEYNKHLINLVSKSLGLKNNIYVNNSTKMLILKYSGKTVFNDILPILEENKQWLFWKESQLYLALTAKQIFPVSYIIANSC
uniref:LAGLIDADG endonuclease family protein n=1 Tax=Pappia fissilis TaxID=1040649 RepID=UPI002A8122DD